MTETTREQAPPDRQQRALEWIRQLTHFRPRFAGTPSERAAAEAVGAWMTSVGLIDVELRSIASAARPGLVIALHAALAFLALRLDGFVGAALAVAVAWSFFSHSRREQVLLARVLPAPPSVNVVGRCGSKTPAQRVVLTAHIDAAQAGAFFSKRVADLFAGATGAGGDKASPIGPLVVPEVTVATTTIVAVVTWLGAHGLLLGLLELLLSLLLLAIALLTLQWALAAPTPGANDNASAVGAMLLAAERLAHELPADVELWAVGTGAEEVGCLGVRSFLAENRAWPKESTWWINFECVGGGQLHYVRNEGLALKTQYPSTLVELARRLVASGKFGAVTPTDLMAGTDGHVPARHGYPTLSLISLESNGVPRNYHRVEDTVEDIDAEVVVRAADLGAATALAAVQGQAGPVVSAATEWHEPF